MILSAIEKHVKESTMQISVVPVINMESAKIVKKLIENSDEKTAAQLQTGLYTERLSRVVKKAEREIQYKNKEKYLFSPSILDKSKNLDRKIDALFFNSTTKLDKLKTLEAKLKVKEPVNQLSLNANSEQALLNRFNKDFTALTSATNGMSMTQPEFFAVIEQLGFLHAKESQEEHQLALDLWKQFAIGHKGFKSHARCVLVAIQNLKDPQIIDNTRETFDKKKLGKINAEFLMFTPREFEHMTKKYLQLFKNRQNFLLNQKKELYRDRNLSMNLYGETLVFTPLIDKKAASLKRRGSIETRLIEFKKTYQQKREDMRQSKEL